MLSMFGDESGIKNRHSGVFSERIDRIEELEREVRSLWKFIGLIIVFGAIFYYLIVH
jgi:hypothetical protein